MAGLDRARGVFAYAWRGPSRLPSSLRLEWRFVAIRWLGILFVTPGLALIGLPSDRLLAAYAVIVVAALYNLVVTYLIRRGPSLLTNGYLTAIGDGLLNVAMISVGGGFNSPLYYLLFTVTISAAMRYGYGPALGMALVYVGFDLGERLSDVPSIISGPFLFRSGFLCITAILAGYLREQARNAEAALEERLHQARLFNEASGMLGGSLDLQSVLEEVAAAACHLFDSGAAVLLSSAQLEDDAPSVPAVALYPPGKRRASHDELEAMIRRHVATHERAEDGHAVHLDTLPSGRRSVVLSLAPSAGHTASTTIALSLPDGGRLSTFDEQILDSFVERIRLAIEHALLYRTLERKNELQHAYADLAKAHDELLSLDEMKTNFLANVSHELRTPLNSIRAFSELLLTYDDPAVQREFLETINSESERLTRLVNDVLDLVKIEAGRMDWRMRLLDVASLIEECARTYAPLIRQTGLAFRRELAGRYPPVEGDWDRLQQVLGNLLNNAAKFTSKGSIRLGARRLGDEVEIFVADTGIGIAPENQARIFDKFQQVGDTLTDKPKGTGLGLPICQEIVAHHGGRIWVESEVGLGSTFRFTLPVASRSVEAAAPERTPEPVLAGAQSQRPKEHAQGNQRRRRISG